jgi:hypothetical protein
MLAALLALLIAAALFVMLFLLVDVYLMLVDLFFGLGILLFGMWVLLNVLGILYFQDHSKPGLALVGNVWSTVMKYTAPYQALMMLVLIFWTFSIVFDDAVTFPETQAAFAKDFIVGTAWLAYIVYVLGFGGFCLFIVPEWSVKLLSGLYVVGMGAVLAVPCFFGGRVDAWLATHGADRMLLAAHTVFLLGSAGGWMLFQAALDAPVPETHRLP